MKRSGKFNLAEKENNKKWLGSINLMERERVSLKISGPFNLSEEENHRGKDIKRFETFNLNDDKASKNEHVDLSGINIFDYSEKSNVKSKKRINSFISDKIECSKKFKNNKSEEVLGRVGSVELNYKVNFSSETESFPKNSQCIRSSSFDNKIDTIRGRKRRLSVVPSVGKHFPVIDLSCDDDDTAKEIFHLEKIESNEEKKPEDFEQCSKDVGQRTTQKNTVTLAQNSIGNHNGLLEVCYSRMQQLVKETEEMAQEKEIFAKQVTEGAVFARKRAETCLETYKHRKLAIKKIAGLNDDWIRILEGSLSSLKQLAFYSEENAKEEEEDIKYEIESAKIARRRAEMVRENYNRMKLRNYSSNLCDNGENGAGMHTSSSCYLDKTNRLFFHS